MAQCAGTTLIDSRDQVVSAMFTPDAPARTTQGNSTPQAQTSVAQAIAALPQFARFASAMKSSSLAAQLNGSEAMTLFAPTDAGFARLPAGVMDKLMAPENATILSLILSHHAVRGLLTPASLTENVRRNGGKWALTSLAGQPLVARLEGQTIVIADEIGNAARITGAEIAGCGNQAALPVNALLMPKPAK